MPLWSLFVELKNKKYSTQVQAASPEAAASIFLQRKTLDQFTSDEEKTAWPEGLTKDDIVLLIPMEGLTNMFLCQVGRAGNYVSLTIVQTVEPT